MNTRLVSPLFRRLAPAVGLFLLAPLVGEYLLGNFSIRQILALLFLAPMYGGGALLIREAARRAGRGWHTMLLLALAYGVLQPSLIDHSMFNPPSLEGLDFRRAAYIPALDLSAAAVVAFPLGHAIWSIGVPIAVVESFVPERRTKPWLGRFGLTAVVLVFLFGCAIIFLGTLVTLPSVAEMISVSVAVLALMVAAFLIGGRQRPKIRRPAPRPWLVGLAAFVASSLFFAKSETWLGIAFGLVLLVAMVVLIARWSRREGWSAAHRLALAGGALLTYAWGGFVLTSLYGRTGVVDLGGNALLAVCAIALLVAAIRTVRRTEGLA